jgi:hypothetical protein
LLVSNVSIPNVNCQSESDGNTNLAIYACILSNELAIYSTLNGQKLANFTNLRVRELTFGDFTNFIYFGGFGDQYFGENSRGSYGAI